MGESDSLRCLVCDKRLANYVEPPICTEHYHEGSPDLREPGKIIESPWLFRHQEGEWLLFRANRSAGGVPGKGWRTYWRAVNVASGERRDFEYAEEIDVWLDLMGVRPAPKRERPARVSLGEWMHQRSSRRDEVLGPDGIFTPQVVELFKTPVPIYGPVGSPLGLKLGGYCTSGSGDNEGITSLSFARMSSTDGGENTSAEQLQKAREELEERIAKRARELGLNRSDNTTEYWEVHSYQPLEEPSAPPRHPPVPTVVLKLEYSQNLSYDQVRHDLLAKERLFWAPDYVALQLFEALPIPVREQLAEHTCRQFCKDAAMLLFECAPDLAELAAAIEPQAIERQIRIEGKEHQGRMLYWPLSRPIAAFLLEYVEALPVITRLEGSAFGIGLKQLLELLEQLKIVNDRADIIADYQAQVNQAFDLLQSYYSK